MPNAKVQITNQIQISNIKILDFDIDLTFEIKNFNLRAVIFIRDH
jgi:hypothetical protein